MPNVADTLQYRHFRNTAFPFVTAPAPTDTSPKFVAGSNIMTSYKGYLERRPGFDVQLEPTPTAFTDPIVRTFCWRRWGGAFYIMLCTVGTTSKVWKLQLGTDASFQQIFSSTFAEPFDFVVSNNFCFFGNGKDMQKFDGTSISNWGIAGPSFGFSGPNAPGTGTTNGLPAWINPGNITAQDGSFATCNVGGISGSTNTPLVKTANTGNLVGGSYGFSIPSNATVNGILVEVNAMSSQSGGMFNANSGQFIGFLTKGGVVVGGGQTSAAFSIGSTQQYYSMGSNMNLWGSTWLPADINSSGFGVSIYALTRWSVNGSYVLSNVLHSVDFIRITVYYSAPNAGVPTVSTSGTGISATNGGYQYVYCYMNSVTGHVSSPSSVSASTGNFTNKTVNIGVTASTDPQVDKIRIFRTTDGGGGVYFEIQNSPVANATTTYPDTTTDANLSLITAPTFGFNDPPPPQKGFVWFANRIWGFNNATLYFTDWEEMNIGVPEEGTVSGPAGNFWNFSSEITGLSVVSDGVLIFLAGHIFKIDGDSLDTFRRTTVADGLGCRQRATITRMGGTTAFLANTNSVWTTDSNSLTEISQMIQPTLDNIDHTQASMTFHLQGQYRWLILGDQGHSQTLAYDVNNEQWMPPWTIVGQGFSSGETSPGTFTLLMGQQTTNTMLQMIPGWWKDFEISYPMSFTTNLLPMTNEHLSSGSPIIDLFYPQAPEHVSYMEFVGMETNQLLPDDVLYMIDDDPSTATYTSIVANIKDAPLKNQGINILDKWYYSRKPTGKRISVQVTHIPLNANVKVYSFCVAYRQYR